MKKKSKALSIISILLFLLASFLVGFALGWLLDAFPQPELSASAPLAAVIVVLVLIATFILSVIIHEAGHLVCGLISGYGFSSFRIFSFMLLKTDEGLRLRRLSVQGTLGQCLMTPPPMKDGRMPVVLYNLGGSLMNFLFFAISLGLYFLLHNVWLLSTFLLFLAGVNLLTGLSNIIPTSSANVDNDGMNAISLTKDPVAMRSFWVQLSATEQLSRGVRIKDMPDEWFVMPSVDEMSNSMAAALGVFCANRLVDQGAFPEALDAIDALLSSGAAVTGLHKQLLVLDKISVSLILDPTYRYDSLITPELNKFMTAMASFPTVLRAQYITKLLGEGDKAGADKLRARFDEQTKNYPYPQDVVSERELLDAALDTYLGGRAED